MRSALSLTLSMPIESGNLLLWCLALAAGAVLFILMMQHPRLALIVFLTSYLIPLTVWSGSGAGTLDTRPLAIAALASQAIRVRASYSTTTVPRQRRWLIFGTGLVMVFALASTIWSQDVTRSLYVGLAWGILMLALFVFPSRISGSSIIRIISWFLTIQIIASAVLILARYPDAFNAGRARGIFFNANGLGIVCALLAAILAASQRQHAKWLCILPAYIAVQTGSRSSVFALSVGLAVVIWRNSEAKRKWIAMPFVLLTFLIASSSLFSLFSLLNKSTNLLILRTNDSRSLNWAQATDAFRLHPGLGVGLGALTTESGGSYIKMLAEGGVIGTIISILLITILFKSASKSTLVVAAISAGLADATFEGWLFSAGSMYCVIVFILAASGHETRRPLVGNNDNLDFSIGNATIRRSVERFRPAPSRFTRS